MNQRAARDSVVPTSNTLNKRPGPELRPLPQGEPPSGAARYPTCAVCEKPIRGEAPAAVGGIFRHADDCSVVEEGKKRKAPFRSNAAALNWLRDRGWVCDTVERQNGPFKFDFLGFADIVGIRNGSVLALQVTTTGGGNFAARVTKIEGSRWALKWLAEGGLIWVFGFGKSKGKWGLRRVQSFQRVGLEGIGSVDIDPEVIV